MSVSDSKRAVAVTACEQLKLRPAGGDFVPDWSGLASQSMACLPQEVAEFFTSLPKEGSACDKAYRNVERMTGLKDKLGISTCSVGRMSAEALGGYGVWRAGLRVVGGVGKTGIFKAATGRRPNLEILEGGRGQPRYVMDRDAAKTEVRALADSGGAPALGAALGPAASDSGRIAIPHILHYSGSEYIVVEIRTAGGSPFAQVFSRSGAEFRGSWALAEGAESEGVAGALKNVLLRSRVRGPGRAG